MTCLQAMARNRLGLGEVARRDSRLPTNGWDDDVTAGWLAAGFRLIRHRPRLEADDSAQRAAPDADGSIRLG